MNTLTRAGSLSVIVDAPLVRHAGALLNLAIRQYRRGDLVTAAHHIRVPGHDQRSFLFGRAIDGDRDLGTGQSVAGWMACAPSLRLARQRRLTACVPPAMP
jgi:hypothetical protein